MYYFKDGILTELDQTLDEVVQELKNKLIMYMLTNHNIQWLSDQTEKELYEILFEFIEPIILGHIMKN